jgi:uncharacterized membrane protein
MLYMNTDHIHPMIVHFPIALVLVAFLTDTLSLVIKKEECLPKLGLYLQILGTLGAIAAVLSGSLFADDISGPAAELKERHEFFAYSTMYLLITATLFRLFLVFRRRENSTLKWVSFGLLLIAVISLGITGYTGGSIVYDIWLVGN